MFLQTDRQTVAFTLFSNVVIIVTQINNGYRAILRSKKVGHGVTVGGLAAAGGSDDNLAENGSGGHDETG